MIQRKKNNLEIVLVRSFKYCTTFSTLRNDFWYKYTNFQKYVTILANHDILMFRLLKFLKQSVLQY